MNAHTLNSTRKVSPRNAGSATSRLGDTVPWIKGVTCKPDKIRLSRFGGTEPRRTVSLPRITRIFANCLKNPCEFAKFVAEVLGFALIG
jgi:hypothetical protein